MGILTPLAVRIGSISWMPRLLPQIVAVDRTVQRLSGDRLTLLDIAGLPNITLIVKGRKSGIERETQLLTAPTGDGWIVAGSYFGSAKMPQWVRNVRAAGEVTVRYHGADTHCRADELSGAERSRAWARLREVWPNFDLYERRTDRTIPVFALEPRGPREASTQS